MQAVGIFTPETALIVIVLVVLIWIGASLWIVTGTRDAWRDIGTGTWSMDHEKTMYGGAGAESAAEREADLKALIDARNERRRLRGEPELDVSEELARLSAPLPGTRDSELEAEIRAHVEARNARLLGAGKPGIDVEAEIARRLSELR